MLNIVLYPCLVLSFLLSEVKAYQYDKVYVKVGLGSNIINNIEFDKDGFKGKIKVYNNFLSFQTGLGYSFTESIRIETLLDNYLGFRKAEISHNTNNDIYRRSSKTQGRILTLNVYKDLTPVANFIPFIGIGVGIINFKEYSDGYAISKNDNIHHSLMAQYRNICNRFSYRISGGLSLALNSDVIVEMSYNCNKLLKNSFDNYKIHNVNLGFRFKI